MAKLTMVEAINLALKQEMEKDPRVLILGEDVGKNGGVFRVTQGLIDIFGEARVMDTPLSESAIAGVAIGMAVYGLRPIAEIQFEGFVYAAMEQLASHAGRIRNRSRGRYHCPLVVRLPYGGAFARRSTIRTATRLTLSIRRESKSSFHPPPMKPKDS